jgi:hypothetical protein
MLHRGCSWEYVEIEILLDLRANGQGSSAIVQKCFFRKISALANQRLRYVAVSSRL